MSKRSTTATARASAATPNARASTRAAAPARSRAAKRVTVVEDDDDGRAIQQRNAQVLAMQHLTLYGREPNGILIWRAYRALRAVGLPIPPGILGKFDEWAAALDSAHGVQQVAAAIEMTGPGGAPQGASRLNSVERARRIVTQFEHKVQRGIDPTAARKAVAAEFGMTSGAVSKVIQRWRAGTEQRQSSKPPSDDVLRMLGRQGR